MQMCAFQSSLSAVKVLSVFTKFSLKQEMCLVLTLQIFMVKKIHAPTDI